MNEKKKFNFKWLEKFKNIKHIEIYVAIIFVVVILLIYLSTTNKSSSSKKTTENNELSVTAYIDNLEQNLAEILNNIGGVSNVKVMITLNMKDALVSDSKINLNQFPDIKGVVITAKGVNTTMAKMKVLHAVEAVIDVTNGNIEILSSE